MAAQYGASTESIPVEDLGLLGPKEDPWGLVIVEGGAEMDEYPKAALLALLASVLYFDSVISAISMVLVVFEQSHKCKEIWALRKELQGFLPEFNIAYI